MYTVQKYVLFFAAMIVSSFVFADDEISLFDSDGDASAYIAVSEDLTIYLWSGAPVAYLKASSGADYDVYGFNGKHLGWFSKGLIWDHDGNASCGVKKVMPRTSYEPYKSYKQYKPYKSYTEYAPYRPYLSSSFGVVPCALLLGSGAQ